MARRGLTISDQLKGIEKAIESPRTPSQLKPGLEKRAQTLRKQLGRERKSSSGVLGILSV